MTIKISYSIVSIGAPWLHKALIASIRKVTSITIIGGLPDRVQILIYWLTEQKYNQTE